MLRRKSIKYKNKALIVFFNKKKKLLHPRSLALKVHCSRAVFLLYLHLTFILLWRVWLRTILFFKYFLRKPEKTSKRLWITPKYVFNISYKSRGSRMGKGKGRKYTKFLKIHAGTPFLEFFTKQASTACRLHFSLQKRWHTHIVLVSNAGYRSTLTLLYWNPNSVGVWFR